MSRDYIAIAAQYQADVVSGQLPACKWVRLACERNRRDLDRQETEAFPYRFDPKKATEICNFAERLPFVSGRGFADVLGRDDLDRPIYKTFELQPWQIWILTALFGWMNARGLRRFRIALLLVPRKNGKALSIDTEIPTPNGLRKMGDINIGDCVYGPDGETTVVVDATPVMIGRPCYRVTFSDGAVFTADGEHLWRAYDRWREKEVVERTDVMASRCRIGSNPNVKERRYRIPVAAPLRMPDRVFLVDPYVLGAWLGDGHTAAAMLTTADGEIAAYCVAVGESARPTVTYLTGKATTYALNDGTRRNPGNLQARLRQIGVLGDKHIPDAYQIGSIDQRWALLQGLMDTDGTVSYSGRRRVPICTFTSIVRRLADGVVRLAAGLGLKPTIIESRAKLRGKDCGPVFDVSFTAFSDQLVFRLPRKQGRLIERPATRRRSTSRHIVSIEPVASVPVRCIQVDRPDGMYLVGRQCVPTHNSNLFAIIALYMLTQEGEPGAQVVSAATTRDQAKMIAEVVWEMANRSPLFREFYGVKMGSRTSHTLSVPMTASKFMPLSSDANSLDGLNISCGLVDEFQNHKTAAVWDVIDTATSSRFQPLIAGIGTAGENFGGVCHAKLAYLEKVLDGTAFDETLFGLNYTIDVDDDWRLPATAVKANPNFGVSVDPFDIERKVNLACQSQEALDNLLVKHFNVWLRSETAWMSASVWQTCAKPEWEKLTASERYAAAIQAWKGYPCWIGVDLGEVRDPSAITLVFKLSADTYGIITRIYWPEDGIAKSPIAVLSGLARQGWIIVTPGNEADYSRIREDLIAFFGMLNVQEIDFDRKSARLMMQDIRAALEPKLGRDKVQQVVLDIPQSVETMDPAMKTTEGLVLGKRLQHDGNPVMAWMVSNVVVERNFKGEIYPRKAGGKDSANKIDGPVSMWTALSRAMIGIVAPPTPRAFVL